MLFNLFVYVFTLKCKTNAKTNLICQIENFSLSLRQDINNNNNITIIPLANEEQAVRLQNIHIL